MTKNINKSKKMCHVTKCGDKASAPIRTRLRNARIKFQTCFNFCCAKTEIQRFIG